MLLLAGCTNDVIELSLAEGADGLPSGFGCVDEMDTRLFAAPLLAGDVIAVFDVIRFDGDPPVSSSLDAILDACDDVRRPCRVHQRVCVPITAPPTPDQARDWVMQHLIDATEMLEIDDLDIAMFRLVGTTQSDPCGRDAAGYLPLEEARVVGCAYTEVVELHDIGTRRLVFELDYPGASCGPADLLTCATVIGL